MITFGFAEVTFARKKHKSYPLESFFYFSLAYLIILAAPGNSGKHDCSRLHKIS